MNRGFLNVTGISVIGKKPSSLAGENGSGALDHRARVAEELSSMVQLTLPCKLGNVLSSFLLKRTESFRTHCYVGSFSTPVAAAAGIDGYGGHPTIHMLSLPVTLSSRLGGGGGEWRDNFTHTTVESFLAC
jgi:hypothetical protein